MEQLNGEKQPTLLACSVFDSKVGVFFQPFFARSRGEATRSFADSANDPNHVFFRHPGDFSLFVLATWTEDDGQFRPLTAPDNLGTALEHRVETPTPPDLFDASREV